MVSPASDRGSSGASIVANPNRDVGRDCFGQENGAYYWLTGIFLSLFGRQLKHQLARLPSLDCRCQGGFRIVIWRDGLKEVNHILVLGLFECGDRNLVFTGFHTGLVLRSSGKDVESALLVRTRADSCSFPVDGDELDFCIYQDDAIHRYATVYVDERIGLFGLHLRNRYSNVWNYDWGRSKYRIGYRPSDNGWIELTC